MVMGVGSVSSSVVVKKKKKKLLLNVWVGGVGDAGLTMSTCIMCL